MRRCGRARGPGCPAGWRRTVTLVRRRVGPGSIAGVNGVTRKYGHGPTWAPGSANCSSPGVATEAVGGILSVAARVLMRRPGTGEWRCSREPVDREVGSDRWCRGDRPARRDRRRHRVRGTRGDRRGAGQGPPARIELNMRLVTFIDSVGISAMVAGFQTAEVSGVKLVVTEPSRFVHRQLWVTGLLGLFGAPEPYFAGAAATPRCSPAPEAAAAGHRRSAGPSRPVRSTSVTSVTARIAVTEAYPSASSARSVPGCDGLRPAPPARSARSRARTRRPSSAPGRSWPGVPAAPRAAARAAGRAR